MSEFKIGCIVERRYLRQEMPTSVIQVLQARGVKVDVLCTAGGRFDPRRGVFCAEDGVETDLNRYDVVIARGRDALSLAMLAYVEPAGVLAINTSTATEAVRNKAHLAIVLERAGIPSAPTMLAAEAATLHALPDEWFPLILKATFGDNSQGLRLVRRRDDLEGLHWSDALVLAQHYLPNAGFDLKLYVCGDRVFAVRKPSPFNGTHDAPTRPVPLERHMLDLADLPAPENPVLIQEYIEGCGEDLKVYVVGEEVFAVRKPFSSTSFTQPGRPCAVTREVREIALRCGQVFGLGLYGLDLVEGADGPCVVDLNTFPGYKGVPHVAPLIADFIAHVATGRVTLPEATLPSLSAGEPPPAPGREARSV